MLIYMRQTILRVVVLSSLLITSLIGIQILGSPTAAAVTSDPKMFVSGDNTFYAYVKSGETVSANFLKSAQVEPLGLPAVDIAVTLEGPGVPQKKCMIAKDVATGQGCGFKDVVAPKSGIWRIQFDVPDTGQLYPQVSPSVRWNRNMFSWSIAVADSAGEKKGRVWSELYSIRQPIEAGYDTNLLYYYVSESGYVYRATYKGYNGQISTLSADAFGIRQGETCMSAYQSVAVDDAKMSPAFGTCGGSYKLFFEQPSGDLPKNAEKWDEKNDWISPAVSRPVVSDLSFEQDQAGDMQSGKISFLLKNYIGQFDIKIDTNNDGNFDATEDVKIIHQIKKLDSGRQEIQFKGMNGDGQPVPKSQRIGVKIDIAKVAEIHLVNADVEGRIDGLEIVRMNGDNAPSSRMCWDDTKLAAIDNQALKTEKTDGRLCPDSTGGVHGWAYGTGSWGDMRYIDDWAYASAKVDGTAKILFPLNEEEMTAVVKKNNTALIIAIVSGILVLAIVGAVVTIVVKKKRRAAAIRAAQAAQIPPEQYPPSQYN